DHKSLLSHRPDQPKNPKVLRVAIIGAPNAGKSTLSCQSPVRCTRPDAMLKASSQPRIPSCLNDADLVLVLVDVSDRHTRHQLHPQVLCCLKQFPQVPSLLVLNKLVVELTEGAFGGKRLGIRSLYRPPKSTPAEPVGKGPGLASAKEDKTPENSKAQKGWPGFREIFMLAALQEEEVDTLKAPQPGPWEYHSDVLTSQSPQEICANLIRARLLEHLPHEVPYLVTQKTALWEEGPAGELQIVQNLEVPKERYVKMLIGQQGQVISKIATEAGYDLMNAFLCEVQLKLSVQLKE
ncbi:hypothetical protein E2320_018035, partial [Naja naja]